MTRVRAIFTDRRLRRVDRQDETWFVIGVDDDVPLDELVGSGDGASFCVVNGDAIVVRVTTGALPSVTAWKPLYATSELFWTVRPNGDVVVADHYRNIMAALPVAERATSDLTEASHHLSRKPYGPLTLAASVFRLTFGTRLVIDVRDGSAVTSVFTKVPKEAEARSRDEYVDDIESALRTVLDDLDLDRVGVMFSGGVDSTLLLALEPRAMHAVTFVPDTPEFGIETAYARRAADAMGVELVEVPAPESTFVERLESVTDATGIPSFSDAGPYYHAAFTGTSFDVFIDGHGADNSFGSNLRLARFSSAFARTPLRQAVTGAASIAPGHLGYRFGQVSRQANGFAADPWDPDGFAGDSRTYGDVTFLDRVFEGIPRRIKEDQLAFVAERIERPGEVPNRFLAHLEIHHWMLAFGGAVYQNHLEAAALGRRAVGPYCDWRVLTAANRIPVEDRWLIGLQSKWILKRLLARMVPDYPINQRKKATALPWKRFYRDGPLTGFFDRYPVPDAFTGVARETVLSGSVPATWTSISFAVWDERIRRNPQLEPVAVIEDASFTV